MYNYFIIKVDAYLILHLDYIQGNNTPLHRTAEKGYTVVTQLLLQSGADKDAKNDVSTYQMFIYYIAACRYSSYITSLLYTE